MTAPLAQQPSREERAERLARLRTRLGRMPILDVPAVAAVDADDMAIMRELGSDRLFCLTITMRYRIASVSAGAPPAERLAEVVLADAIDTLRSSLRSSDLLLAQPPDLVVILAPAAEPLEGRGLVRRLEGLLHHRLTVDANTTVDVLPRFGSLYCSPAGPFEWDLPTLVGRARASSQPASGVFYPPT